MSSHSDKFCGAYNTCHETAVAKIWDIATGEAVFRKEIKVRKAIICEGGRGSLLVGVMSDYDPDRHVCCCWSIIGGDMIFSKPLVLVQERVWTLDYSRQNETVYVTTGRDTFEVLEIDLWSGEEVIRSNDYSATAVQLHVTDCVNILL
jgi:hypothetical protein